MAIDLEKFDKINHPLQRPLLVISNAAGCLSCGYLNMDSFERNGDAGAIVRGVDNFDDMLAATVMAVSSKAAALGAKEGMTGEQVLQIYQDNVQ